MKTGIFSGSFDPIHTGHLIIADYLCEYEELDEIWFIVSPHNPLKNSNELSDDIHRAEMVKRAIVRNEKFKFSDIEFSLPKPSYTINTLDFLKEKYPERDLYLIIGSDNWLVFDKWRDYQRIKKEYDILIYPRPGHVIKKEDILQKNIKLTQAPVIEISSTLIRNGIKEGKNMNYFVPESVYDYIVGNNLYCKK
ncbi:nicotinate (nicotinamide) nucleotide adenylyltransferase [Coprobacter sp. LH1063]|uniref:Probable nicotinate-nucleotide adenylyltransferase n=1 Tax=Coprobacter tertius TaxID=2944915 RepID=A0ABT1MH36_9BACT|nr:nicotinate (nicotinamide) nucleotide adenylyltransferase [Coprobacter tertius]